MGFARIPLALLALFLTPLLSSPPVQAQQTDRIWGRVTTVAGDMHEGYIRWDVNEGSWMDQLDGSKAFSPFRFQDWWNLAHPDDRHRDRVIELAGYRITWDDDEPEFPDTHESGIRFGHLRRLTVAGDDMATLELRSGLFVDLEGGSTDLGGDLREILVTTPDGNVAKVEWEDLDEVEFFPAPPGARAVGRRLHGTVELDDDLRLVGYIAWDMRKILTSDTLNGFTSDESRRDILFDRVSAIRPTRRGAEISLIDGGSFELFDSDDVDEGNDGILVSDPGLGSVEVEWDEVDHVRLHPPGTPVGLDHFDGGERLRGTVTTTDSTELTGWIRWDGDEQYTWELLDGQNGGRSFDVEFGQIESIERYVGVTTEVEVGPTGVNVQTAPTEGATVTLRDGRILELDGSNDVDEDNDGIFLIVDGSGQSPDDEEAEWVMVKWEDFRSVRFESEGGP
jgi:hypothetical protein